MAAVSVERSPVAQVERPDVNHHRSAIALYRWVGAGHRHTARDAVHEPVVFVLSDQREIDFEHVSRKPR